MNNRVWGALVALGAIVQASAAGAQSGEADSWTVEGGWKVTRGAVGCGTSRDADPFFVFTQRLDGGIYIGLRAPGGSFQVGDPVTLQFQGQDANKSAVINSYDGMADTGSTGTLVVLRTRGDLANDGWRADSVIVSRGPGRRLQPVALPDFYSALRSVRRCMTELRRIDRGSGRPAVTTPVLLNPRSPLVTSDDYPPAATREEAQGVTLAALTISAKGLISYCRIKRSSGRVDLDEQTCISLSRRARYTPAIDDQGNPTEGETTQPIRWQLAR